MSDEFEFSDELISEVQAAVDANDPAAVQAFQSALREELSSALSRAAQRVKLNGNGKPPAQQPAQSDQAELARQYSEEMQAHRGEGLTVGRQIRAKYARMGLEVDRVNASTGSFREQAQAPAALEADPAGELEAAYWKALDSSRGQGPEVLRGIRADFQKRGLNVNALRGRK